jgi:hypothetical protein
LKSIRAKIKKLHAEWALVEKDAKEEHHRLQLIEQFAMFAQQMNTTLSTLGLGERNHLVRLLVEEVTVNTSTEEITVRHILPVDQTLPLCKRSNDTASYADFAAFKTAIGQCLAQTHTTHRSTLDLLTLRFQLFEKAQSMPA